MVAIELKTSISGRVPGDGTQTFTPDVVALPAGADGVARVQSRDPLFLLRSGEVPPTSTVLFQTGSALMEITPQEMHTHVNLLLATIRKNPKNTQEYSDLARSMTAIQQLGPEAVSYAQNRLLDQLEENKLQLADWQMKLFPALIVLLGFPLTEGKKRKR